MNCWLIFLIERPSSATGALSCPPSANIQRRSANQNRRRERSPAYSCHFVSGVSRRVQPKMKKIAAAILFATLAAYALWLCLNLKITQNYSDVVVGRIAWVAATKWQDLMAMPFFIAFACVSIAITLSAQRSRAFFSDIAQGVEREDSIGLDAGGAGSIAKRWRRPRSDPEYTERRSDAVQAAEKCSKARGEASIP